MVRLSPSKLLLTLFMAFLFTIVFSSNALAQESITTPNPGDPITVDGDISDWDLDADFYNELYRYPDFLIHEADAYLRYHYDADTSTGMMYLLVLSLDTTDIIPDPSRTTVKIDGVAPTDLIKVYVNLQGDYAQGWEASFSVSEGSHEIYIRTLIEDDGVEYLAKLPGQIFPISIYPWDFGDLPDSYGTTEAANGPRHTAGRPRLGTQVDGEVNGQPETNPILDDLNGRNDEDGVIPIGNWLHNTPTIQYTVNGCPAPDGCYLNAWFDWGQFDPDLESWQPDGIFDPGDEVFTNLLVTDGTYLLPITLPDGVGFAATFNVRFRLCDTLNGCATPHSLSATDAPLGEVEDYQWAFSPNAVTLNSFSATPNQNSQIGYIFAGLVTASLFAGTIILLNKRKNFEVYS